MRVLHTSDWHLGARLCDRERIDEQKEFLDWLKETINKESIDILLVSGDIFDSTNPPNNAEMLYFDFLCSIKESGCCAVIVTGGNHDSVSKLNSPKALLKQLSVYVYGGAGDSPEKDVILIENHQGIPIASVCAVPFLRERDIHIPKAGENWKEREIAVVGGIAQYYSRALEQAKILKDNLDIPIIAMGHLFVTGSQSATGERDLYVGNLGAVNCDIFSRDFDYTALGHIHKSQKIAQRDDIRYCGSPLHMDFGETGEKFVIIADFKDSSLKEVIKLKVPHFRKFIRFKGTFENIMKELETFTPPESPYWVDAEILGGNSVGDISSLLNDKAQLVGFEFLRIKIKYRDAENVIVHEKSVEINDLNVDDVFLKRCEKSDMDQNEIDELFPLYRELVLTVEEEGDPVEN